MIFRPGIVLTFARTLAIGVLAAVTPARADEAENYRLLQAMPRERRVALAENLERFDKLDRSEQTSIRRLDTQIASKDPVEQARYRALLRRYHLWVIGLTEEQKKELKEASGAEARFAMARKFRSKDSPATLTGPRLAGIRTGDLGLVAPYEAANLLRIWNKLDPAKKSEIEKQHERGRLFAAIRAEARAAGVRFEGFPAADEAEYLAKIEANAELKQLPPKGPEASKKVDPASKKADAPRKWFERPFAEFLYFEDHRPWPVSQRNLERFSTACPAWLHSMTDPLSPDDARQYLTILYRLLYPHPGEMLTESRPAKAQAVPPSAPRPAPKKANNTGPI